MPTDFTTWFVVGAALATGAGLITVAWFVTLFFISWIIGGLK